MPTYYDESNQNDINQDNNDNNVDDEPMLTQYDLDMLTIEEVEEATLFMYKKLKEYIDNRSFLFPIMDKLNTKNFYIWFSEHLENSILKKS